MTLLDFNGLSKEDAGIQLFNCCGSLKWKDIMVSQIPFADEQLLIQSAHHAWYHSCNEGDWLESFTHHPKIGDVKSLSEKFSETKHLAGDEQSGIKEAGNEILAELIKANREYEAKFGFIFIVCATGKSAAEMLHLIKERIHNEYKEELYVAMGEQGKITVLRMQKMLGATSWKHLKGSQVTSHVLDTSIGKPGLNITIRLKRKIDGTWETMAQGITNADGRIADLLPSGRIIDPGDYKMVFNTGEYFKAQHTKGFYPEVDIQFSVLDDTHYHVPLLINPFGYSTYRGS